jgi:hypothetical protein
MEPDGRFSQIVNDWHEFQTISHEIPKTKVHALHLRERSGQQRFLLSTQCFAALALSSSANRSRKWHWLAMLPMEDFSCQGNSLQ